MSELLPLKKIFTGDILTVIIDMKIFLLSGYKLRGFILEFSQSILNKYFIITKSNIVNMQNVVKKDFKKLHSGRQQV